VDAKLLDEVRALAGIAAPGDRQDD